MFLKPMRDSMLGLAVASLVGGCSIATPYRAASNMPDMAAKDKVLVAITHATLNGDNALEAEFFKHTKLAEASLKDQPGFLGFSKRAELFGKNAWTMTVWQDKASMLQFVHGEAHQTAIKQSYAALAASRFAHFEVDAAQIPLAWDQALAYLDQYERRHDGE